MSHSSRSVFTLRTLPFALLSLFLVAFLASCGEANHGDVDKEETQEIPFVPAEGASPYIFDVRMLSEQRMSQDGQSTEQELQGSGTMTLTEGTATTGGVLWKSDSDMNVIVVVNGEAKGDQVQRQEMIYTVSPEGKIINLQVGGMQDQVGAEMQQLLQRSAGGQTGMQMFLQKDWLNKTVGDTWSDNLLDTVQIDSIPTKSGRSTESAYLVLDIKTDYTYEGDVDTLGRKTVRISYKINEIKMEGKIITSGNEMTITSNGTGSGVFYYDIADHLQVATRTLTKVEMMIGMPSADTYLPVSQTMTVDMTRK